MKHSLLKIATKPLQLLALFILFTLTHSALAQTFTDGGINYNVVTGTTVKVGNNYNFTGIANIPATVTDSDTGITYNVTAIGNNAFSNSGLTSVTIPSSVITIGDSAFNGCLSLISVYIGDSVTYIGPYAFYDCVNLNSLSIGDSVTNFSYAAFWNCYSLTSVTVKNPTPVDINGFDVFFGLDQSQCALFVPGGSESDYNATDIWTDFNPITAIPLTFTDNGIVYNVTNQYTTVEVGYNQSYAGTSDLIIPATVTNSGITYEVTTIIDDAFRDVSSLTSVNIGNSVTTIGNFAFRFCSTLTSLTIGNSVTSIGGGAFSGCSGLTSLTIGTSVATIGNSAFRFCSNLTSLTIPNSVTSIVTNAFSSCTSLTSLTIGNSVVSIDNSAFANCFALTSVTCNAAVPPSISSDVFTGLSQSACSLTVPNASVSLYQVANVWKDFNPIKSSTGLDWTSRTCTADEGWQSVTYGNGVFVAVSINETTNGVMTSIDGITWTARTAPQNAWCSVVYAKGLFVAVAISGEGNRVMTSPNGINWTSRTSAEDNSWYSVTYGNGVFVAVSSGSDTGKRVMTSPDGINWTSRDAAFSVSWSNITYGNGLFVAVGSAGSGNNERIMTSPDGINWTLRTAAADNIWRATAYGNGMFVAVAGSGSGNRVMTSPDGITWTSRNAAVDNQWSHITFANELFVAVSANGSGNRVMISPDGITWTSRISAANNSWSSVTYANGIFVAVSEDGGTNSVMTSGVFTVPTTQIKTTQCGQTIAAINTPIYPDVVIGNIEEYTFEVSYNNSVIGSVITPNRYFRLNQVTGTTYNRSYSIRVAIKFNGTYGAYGSACSVTVAIPTTQIKAVHCGTILDGLSTALYADVPVTGIEMYKFEVFKNNVSIGVKENTANYFRLNQIPAATYNTEYRIKVALKMNGSYGAYNESNSCTINTSIPTTQIKAVHCGTTLSAFNTPIYADVPVIGIEMYQFEVFKNNVSVGTKETTSNYLRINEITAVTYSTEYRIKVKLKMNGNYGAYNESNDCIVTTPAPPQTQIKSDYCGINLDNLSTPLYTDLVIANIEKFRYEVSDSNGKIGEDIETVNNYLRLTQFTAATYNKTYTVKVAIRVKGIWSTYREEGCSITTPVVPITRLKSTQCGRITPSLETLIVADVVSGSEGYKFQISRSGIVIGNPIETTNNYFKMSQIIGVEENKSYDVKVAVKYNNVYGPYGQNCTIYGPAGAPPLQEENTTNEMSRTQANEIITQEEIVAKSIVLKAYPNPFTNAFKLDYTPLTLGKVTTTIYDITGKVIETRTFEATQAGNQEFGGNYGAGIYMMNIAQGGNSQNIKIIKQ